MTEEQEQRPGASTEPPRVNAESWGRCGHRPHLPMTANRHTHTGEFASCYDDHSSARAGAASTEATPPHSLSCEVVETLGSGHERCQCTCHDGELRASTEATERPDLRAITDEHRQCGTPNGYDGCYAHFPMPHCRADGMAWPCDVDRLRAALTGASPSPAEATERPDLRAALDAADDGTVPVGARLSALRAAVRAALTEGWAAPEEERP